MSLGDRYAQIQQLIDINRQSQAKQLIQEGLEEYPQDVQLLYFLSLIQYRENEHELGIETAQYGLSQAPKDIDLRHILFSHLESTRRYAEAELMIIDLIRENPADSHFLADYANLMLSTFHIKKARSLVNEALRLNPHNRSAQLIEVLLDITDGRFNDSEKRLRQLVGLDPQSEDVLRFLLIQLVEKKKHRAALVLTQELLRRNPLDTQLVDLIIELRAVTHWTAIPLWPLQQLGLMGTFLLWFTFIALVFANRFVQWEHFSYIVYGYLGYCLYSWLQEPIMRKIIKS